MIETEVEKPPINQSVEDWIANHPDSYEGLGDESNLELLRHSEVIIPATKFGVCESCRMGGTIKPLYQIRYWVPWSDDIMHSNSYCAEHLEKSWMVDNLHRMVRFSDWTEGMFFDVSTFPVHDMTNIEHCAACEEIIGDETMLSNIVVYARPSYRRALAIVNGMYVGVHEGCSIFCHTCTKRYPSRGQDIVRFHSVNNEDMCSTCWDNLPDGEWTTCDSCSTYMLHDDGLWSRINNERVCQQCHDQEYECRDCANWVASDDHDCDYDSNDDDYDEPPRVIHNYSYKPAALFFGDTKYHFGLELEVEAKVYDNYSTGAESVVDIMGQRAYLKHDGSLNQGFEIVTHPHSLQEMQEKFPWEILEKLKELNFRSWKTSTCGLHVHVSRTAFSAPTADQRDTHQIKFMKLIYDNKDQVQKLAGRKSSWAKFDDKGQVIRKVKYGYQSANRYSAVNVENSNTLEVRVFRGSLRKERVLSAVEFVHAAVEYTRDLKIVPKDKPFEWTTFIGYVTKHKDIYPNMLTIVNEMLAKAQTTISRQEEPV